MVRFYIPPVRIHTNTQSILFSQKEWHYLVSVMRLKDKETFCVFDGKGNEYTAVIGKKQSKKDTEAAILSHTFTPPDDKILITLALCMLKGEKMDIALQKATELGVSKIIPVLSARTIPRANTAEWDKKKARYATIVKEAAEQCGRITLPVIEDAAALKSLKPYTEDVSLALFFNENEKQNALNGVLEKNKNVSSVLFLVGPEGGFSDEEAAFLKENGFYSVSIGKRILRAETACIYGLSVLTYEFMV